MPPRVFLLSPARCSGIRAGYLLRSDGASALAVRLRAGEGIPLGDLFTFMSGLYFRGKLAYARHFGTTEPLVIVPGRGLVPASEPVPLKDLHAMADIPVDPRDERYHRPLRRDSEALRDTLADGNAILLGSIATNKYLEVLTAALGQQLLFPRSFVGRGDMSRGALLLRCTRRRRELRYIPACPPG